LDKGYDISLRNRSGYEVRMCDPFENKVLLVRSERDPEGFIITKYVSADLQDVKNALKSSKTPKRDLIKLFSNETAILDSDLMISLTESPKDGLILTSIPASWVEEQYGLPNRLRENTIQEMPQGWKPVYGFGKYFGK